MSINNKSIYNVLDHLKYKVEFDLNLISQLFILEASGTILTSPNFFNPA